MIGLLIVAHYNLGDEFARALQLILGDLEQFQAVGLDPHDSPSSMLQRVEKAMREVETEDGVLILVDMFGGTPTNVCLSLLEKGRVEVVTGVNLPMLVKVAGSRDREMHELAALAQEYGRKNISVASEILARRTEKAAPDEGDAGEDSG